MGLQSSFDTNRDELNMDSSGTRKLTVDLSTFLIGGTPIGKAPWDGDFFASPLIKEESLIDEPGGYELFLVDGVLDSAFITLTQFRGLFLLNNKAISLTKQTTREEIETLFGAPYWTDLDDGEVINFYEYRAGKIELQFEFTDGQHLAFITLAHHGVLSDSKQREQYGVTKPWPPSE